MSDETLRGKKLDVYVMLKIIKYCTDSSARSYQIKFAVDQGFKNKSIESMKLGAAIKEIMEYQTIRGKFSSVHPALAAEGITRVEVGEEGLHFIKANATNQVSFDMREAKHLKYSKRNLFSDEASQEAEMPDPVKVNKEEMMKRIFANVNVPAGAILNQEEMLKTVYRHCS